MMARRQPANFARSLLVTGNPPRSKTSMSTTSVSSTSPSPQIRGNSAIRDRIARGMPGARAQQPSARGSGVVTGARFDLAGLQDPGTLALAGAITVIAIATKLVGCGLAMYGTSQRS